jgi:hypothetical protein
MVKRSLVVTLILITISFYFFLDRELFYFGESTFEFYRLPFHIKPENRPTFESGFILWDSSRMSLVGKGVKYWGYDSIEIERIVAYGFNDTMLIAITADLKDQQHTFKFSSPDTATKFDMKIQLVNEQAIPTNLTWINILNAKNIYAKALIRNWLCLINIGLAVLCIALFLKRKDLNIEVK